MSDVALVARRAPRVVEGGSSLSSMPSSQAPPDSSSSRRGRERNMRRRLGEVEGEEVMQTEPWRMMDMNRR
eukprot:8788969-Pyramimonas_sp.AAC.1